MLEVCVDNIESALAASQGGACRIELCAALNEGGLTPSPGSLVTLKQYLHIDIPIFCMLRPRPGNDFVYSEAEMNLILRDMEYLRLCGADGFVFGALNNNGTINVEQCANIVKNAENLPVTFHRAFDLTSKTEMHKTCRQIKSLGFNRILTSGFEISAESGLESIKEIVCAHPEIIVVPAAGITAANVTKILRETHCKEYHASARRQMSLRSSNIPLGEYFVTQENLVRELVNICSKQLN